MYIPSFSFSRMGGCVSATSELGIDDNEDLSTE